MGREQSLVGVEDTEGVHAVLDYGFPPLGTAGDLFECAGQRFTSTDGAARVRVSHVLSLPRDGQHEQAENLCAWDRNGPRMSLSSSVGRFRPYSVPLCLSAVVAAAVLFVPPLVLGDATGRTYALTTAVLIVAISSVLPYAVAVGVLTVPFLYTGLGSYAAPGVLPTEAEPFSLTAALRHVIAGISYVVAATAVGAVGIGVDFAASSGSDSFPAVGFPPFPALGFPPFLLFGGVVIAGVYVVVQLWRYERPMGGLAWKTVLGTVVLGAFLAASPVIALWIFGSFGF